MKPLRPRLVYLLQSSSVVKLMTSIVRPPWLLSVLSTAGVLTVWVVPRGWFPLYGLG